MIYCTDVVTKGNPYKIYRNEALIEQYHGIVDELTDNLFVYIGFFGEADIKIGDVLENTENRRYYVVHTALTSVYKHNDKLLVICKPLEFCSSRPVKKQTSKERRQFLIKILIDIAFTLLPIIIEKLL